MILSNSVIEKTLTLDAFLICLATALACGLVIAIAAGIRTHQTKSMFVSLILLPPIVSTVILMVNGNVGTGIAVAGAFSLIRFQSVRGKAKDIASVFLSMSVGLICAGGFIGLAAVTTVIISVILVLLNVLPLGFESEKVLKVTLPEETDYETALDEVLKQYTTRYSVFAVKTVNFGSLLRVTYLVKFKRGANKKEFFDAIRTRNANLEVSLSERGEEDEL